MFSYDMTKRGGETLYEYLYRCIRHDIAHGIVPAGQKLPSKRALAGHLGVSLVTVEAAYRQLVAEGYMISCERSGYFVCELAPAEKVGLLSDGSPSSLRAGSGEPPSKFEAHSDGALLGSQVGIDGSTLGVRAAADGSALDSQAAAGGSLLDFESAVDGAEFDYPVLADFTRGDAATKIFPYSAWAKTVRRVLSDSTPESLAQASSAAGSPQLRRAIANYLREYRGMSVSPDQIIIGAGSQALYQLVVQLLGRQKTYAIETPGYSLLAKMYAALNAKTCLISVDEQGANVGALTEFNADVLHVMPSHQFPTGVVMSAARRRELLNWTREAPGRFIIEDDYDSEFRMRGRPVSTLFGIDAAGKVLYLNSFAKSLGDAFRIAYLVLPESLTERFGVELGFYSNTVSPLDQLALARFIEEGHYERHVNRLRTHARRSQDALVETLRKGPLAGHLRFESLGGGLHFVMVLEDERSELELVNLARETGVSLSPMESFMMSGAAAGLPKAPASCEGMPRFVLRYDGSDESAAEDAARALESAWS